MNALTIMLILLQATPAPDLLSYGLTSAAAAGPVGVLLMLAVVYFAKRDGKREDREREDHTLLVQALGHNTAALVEARKQAEASDKLRAEVAAILAKTVACIERVERRLGD